MSPAEERRRHQAFESDLRPRLVAEVAGLDERAVLQELRNAGARLCGRGKSVKTEDLQKILVELRLLKAWTEHREKLAAVEGMT